MDARKKSAGTIDQCIAQFPGEIQEKLQQLRQTIREAAPQAEEAISFRMPAFRLNGTLVYFAAFRDHISFFPTSSAITAFRSEISRYKTSKGTVQFPLDEPIPLDLVRKMVRFRVEESLRKKETRKR
jgi:uncharacterized protein YdhG (YjbR/CyaY superfamily)